MCNKQTMMIILITRCSAIAERPQGVLQFSPKVEDWNWETIFYRHYRSIFNHCDIIGLKICRIP